MTRIHHTLPPAVDQSSSIDAPMHRRPSALGKVTRYWLPMLLVSLTGCQSLGGNRLLAQGESPTASAARPTNPVIQVTGEEREDQGNAVQRAGGTPASLAETTKQSTNRVLNFVTGRENANLQRAQQFYREGDATFRQAQELEPGSREKMFAKAAKSFRKSVEASAGEALQQDAMFMQAESLFFANQLPQAAKQYEKLQKDFPRNRHSDRISARLFSISKYWIETVKADQNKWIPLNLTDPKRPKFDVDGHAVRVLDQIRFDDPTGRLADDATMAAAAEHIRQGNFEKADEFLTDLRETFTDSEHLFLAHMLGLKCKLEVYAGPDYSGLVLDEAEQLLRQTRQRFPDRLREQKYSEMLGRIAAEISYHRAERLANKARWREKRHEYGAARVYYQELLTQFPSSPQAETARQRLVATESLPAIPTPQLAWLAEVFPDQRKAAPLKTIENTDENTPPNKTMLR